MVFSPLLEKLVRSLRCFPGVGPKSAQRMALYLLERNRPAALELADLLVKSVEQIGHCERCRILCESSVCAFCSNMNRNQKQWCVVESPSDVLAVEQSGQYRGVYFVLNGHLSAIDGIGPEDIGLPFFEQRLLSDMPDEIILALNPTVEGEATVHYIVERLKGVKVQLSRIAYGIPIGGSLEYVDGGTIAKALGDRSILNKMKNEEIII